MLQLRIKSLNLQLKKKKNFNYLVLQKYSYLMKHYELALLEILPVDIKYLHGIIV